VAALWPPELAGFMAALNPGKETVFSPPRFGPVITSPLPGGVIALEDSGGQIPQIPLKSERAKGLVYWYVDDEFHLAAPAALTPLLALTPGRHKVSLLDSAGQTAGAEFTVMYAQDRDRDQGLPILSF
jgi:hypothetical protein